MPVFQTIVHPTDFDEPSKEAFRVARSLAQILGARVVVFHVVSPPAIVTQDGRGIHDPHRGEPVDLWAEHRVLEGDGLTAPVQYAIVVSEQTDSWRLLELKIRELGKGTLVVMGSHGRRGLRRLVWGSAAEEVVRECPCPVLVVKAPKSTTDGAEGTASAGAA